MSKQRAKGKDSFTSTATENRYVQYTSNRSFCFERGFELAAGENWGLPDFVVSVIHRRNCLQFAKQPPPTQRQWVQEFYANFLTQEGLEEEDWVVVRKEPVLYVASAINRLYELEDVEDNYAEYLSSLTPEDWDQMLGRMCEPGSQWKHSPQGALTVNRACLKVEVKVWYHFLITRLMPSTHCQTINGERIALLDTMLSTRSLNVGRIIEQQIRQCAEKKKG